MSSRRLRLLALLIVGFAGLAVWLLRPAPATPPAGVGDGNAAPTGVGSPLQVAGARRADRGVAPGTSDRKAVTTPAKAPPTILKGKAVHRADSKPVAGARVMLFFHQMNGETTRLLSDAEREPYVTDTDENGTFELKMDLPRDTEWRGNFYLYAPGMILVQQPVMALESGRKIDLSFAVMKAGDGGRNAGLPFGPPAEMKRVWETMRAMGMPPTFGSLK